MSGLLLRPLLFLWRQSVELSIKAAIIETAGEIRRNPGHDLTKLFAQLIEVRAELGCCDDDDYTCKVTDMIALVQSFDPFADRFRYPTARGGKPFEGIDTDFDELFQAHWNIVTWCEGATIEIVESRPPAGATV
jgi:HEPN domain-containing protein